jgi:hypothetical protein
MPKLLSARTPEDAEEERKIRKLAASRHAPGDWIFRARIISLSWQGLRTSEIAEELGCHPKTVRKRVHRFNAEGIDGLGETVPEPDANPASPKTSAPGSSLCSPRILPGDLSATMACHLRLLMRMGPPTGPWTPWPRTRKRWASRLAAAR